MTVDPLTVVVSALGGAVGAALLGLLGAWIQSKRAHRAWLDSLRWEVYRDWLQHCARESMRLGQGNLPEKGPEANEWALSMQQAIVPVTMLGPTIVAKTAGDMLAAILGQSAKSHSLDYQLAQVAYLAAVGDTLRTRTWWVRFNNRRNRRARLRAAKKKRQTSG